MSVRERSGNLAYIPYGRQNITQADVHAVLEVLQSDFLTQGPMVARFEETLCRYTGSQYATVVTSATAALHLACLALGVGVGDSVWTSPNTFVASANCALYCGAGVDFVDIDPYTYNLCMEKLAIKLKQAELLGCLPKVIIPVHFAGQSCDMKALKALSDQYGFRVIEDASHAVGATYLDMPVGCGKFSDITVFSFHPVKIITTGEGGAALSNCQVLAEKLSRLRTHGITRDKTKLLCKTEGDWYYEQHELGYNYRITDLQCALGISQIQRIDEFVARRNSLAKRYNSLLKGHSIALPHMIDDCFSSFHLYVIQIIAELPTGIRRLVFDGLRAKNIGVNVHYIPVYKQPYYRDLGFTHDYCEQAEHYYSAAISLPLYPDLTHAEQDRVVKELLLLLEMAS